MPHGLEWPCSRGDKNAWTFRRWRDDIPAAGTCSIDDDNIRNRFDCATASSASSSLASGIWPRPSPLWLLSNVFGKRLPGVDVHCDEEHLPGQEPTGGSLLRRPGQGP